MRFTAFGGLQCTQASKQASKQSDLWVALHPLTFDMFK